MSDDKALIGDEYWKNGKGVASTIESTVKDEKTFRTYCFQDYLQTGASSEFIYPEKTGDDRFSGRLPNSTTSDQTFNNLWKPRPFPSFNCGGYATLNKPGINPLTLRGLSSVGSADGVNDTKGICLMGAKDFKLEKYKNNYHGVSMFTTQACFDDQTTSVCKANPSACLNNARGGLADWMGRPKSASQDDDMRTLYFKYVYGNSPHSFLAAENNVTESRTGYNDPISTGNTHLMRFGFNMDSCECQKGTYFLSRAYKDPKTNDPTNVNYSDLYVPNTKAEIWNGNNTAECTGGDGAKCSDYIQKFAKSCEWCQNAEVTVEPLHDLIWPNVDLAKDLKSYSGFFGHQRVSGGKDLHTRGNARSAFRVIHDLPCRCETKYGQKADAGDCFGLGANGKPRIPCKCGKGINSLLKKGVNWGLTQIVQNVTKNSSDTVQLFDEAQYGQCPTGDDETKQLPYDPNAKIGVNGVQQLSEPMYSIRKDGQFITKPESFFKGNLPDKNEIVTFSPDETVTRTGRFMKKLSDLAENEFAVRKYTNGYMVVSVGAPKWRPNDTGDCGICTSSFWKWIPGGVDAVNNTGHPLHNIAKNAYTTKEQEVFGNYQPITQNISGETFQKSPATVKSFNRSQVEQKIQFPDNAYSSVCDSKITGGVPTSGAKYTWSSTSDKPLSYGSASNYYPAPSKMISNAMQSSPEYAGEGLMTAFYTNDAEKPRNNACYNMFDGRSELGNKKISNSAQGMCIRNPTLSLIGNSEEENDKLAKQWIDGTLPNDPIGKQSEEERQLRTIKALRCCIGQTPGFKHIGKTSPGRDEMGPERMERWSRPDCPPAAMCPSSNFCRQLYKDVITGQSDTVKMDLYKFGEDFPNGYTLDGMKSEKLSKDVLMEPAYYAKTYCQFMSGTKKSTSGQQQAAEEGKDTEFNMLCRKAMYKFCTDPVDVTINQDNEYKNAKGETLFYKDKYSQQTFKLPVNILHKNCYRWFRGELANSLPSDYGTRDMALGSTCQVLQQEGWINPTSARNSELLGAFSVTKDGPNNTKLSHIPTNKNTIDLNYFSNLGHGPDEVINHVCGCFYTGGTCDNANCSYYYCGAGDTQGSKVEFFGNESSTEENEEERKKTFRKAVPLGNYIKDNSWTKFGNVNARPWTSKIDSTKFTCVETRGSEEGISSSHAEDGQAQIKSSCFQGCNYTNSYDTCSNASSKERKIDFDKSKWKCNPLDPNNTCTSNELGCFGSCPIAVDGQPNCGTDSSFKKSTRWKPFNPKQAMRDDSPRAIQGNDFPMWQNMYSDVKAGIEVEMPGSWGNIYKSGDLRKSLSACGSNYSIKPYGLEFGDVQSCSISTPTIMNNNGQMIGSVSVNVRSNCNLSSFDTSTTETKNATLKKLKYLGSIAYDPTDEEKLLDSDICLDQVTGDNCLRCGEENDDKKGKNGAPKRPLTCCLSPSLNASAARENATIYQTIQNNNVSYFCWDKKESDNNTCPVGSRNLDELRSICKCESRETQADCQSCEYCKWFPNESGTSGTCRTVCSSATPPQRMIGEGTNSFTSSDIDTLNTGQNEALALFTPEVIVTIVILTIAVMIFIYAVIYFVKRGQERGAASKMKKAQMNA